MSNLILFGAGDMGRRALVGLRAQGIEPRAFMDNDSELWGKCVDGLRVVCPLRPRHRVAVTVYNGSIVRYQLAACGFNVMSAMELAALYPGVLFGGMDRRDEIKRQWKQVTAAALLWDDAQSAAEYLRQVAFRLRGRGGLERHDRRDWLYFHPGIVNLPRPYFAVDAGACYGEVTQRIIDKFGSGKILAIEPDRVAATALEKRYSGSNVELFRVALTDRCEPARFTLRERSDSSLDDDGDELVMGARLDCMLRGRTPDYVKADVEGAELAMLRGAQDTLRQRRTTWAICAYHKQDDLWKIPLLIKRIEPRHRLFLRRYAEDCWEIVIYAVPT